MGTVIRPEISERHPYWLDRHRYYELKHFCLQYPIWKKEYRSLDGYAPKSTSVLPAKNGTGVGDPTSKYAEARLYFAQRIQMVEEAAFEASHELGRYILQAVTEGCSFDHMSSANAVPCCRETWYDLYRRFFWLLSKARN